MSAVVYWLLDAEDNILYVGCTKDLKNRMTHHSQTKTWWPSVASVAHTSEMSHSEALRVEHMDIYSLQPIHNIYSRTPIAPTPEVTLHRLLTSSQSAVLLGCTARTVNRLVAAGTLSTHSVIPGGRHGIALLDRAVVETLAAKRSASAA